MKIALALIALLAAGCAAAPSQPGLQYRWVKNGVSQDETAREVVQCQQYGSQIAVQKMRIGDQGPYYDDRIAVVSSPLAAYTRAATHECLAELGYQLVPGDAVAVR
jgi:hypothetical protein